MRVNAAVSQAQWGTVSSKLRPTTPAHRPRAECPAFTAPALEDVDNGKSRASPQRSGQIEIVKRTTDTEAQ